MKVVYNGKNYSLTDISRNIFGSKVREVMKEGAWQYLVAVQMQGRDYTSISFCPSIGRPLPMAIRKNIEDITIEEYSQLMKNK